LGVMVGLNATALILAALLYFCNFEMLPSIMGIKLNIKDGDKVDHQQIDDENVINLKDLRQLIQKRKLVDGNYQFVKDGYGIQTEDEGKSLMINFADPKVQPPSQYVVDIAVIGSNPKAKPIPVVVQVHFQTKNEKIVVDSTLTLESLRKEIENIKIVPEGVTKWGFLKDNVPLAVELEKTTLISSFQAEGATAIIHIKSIQSTPGLARNNKTPETNADSSIDTPSDIEVTQKALGKHGSQFQAVIEMKDGFKAEQVQSYRTLNANEKEILFDNLNLLKGIYFDPQKGVNYTSESLLTWVDSRKVDCAIEQKSSVIREFITESTQIHALQTKGAYTLGFSGSVEGLASAKASYSRSSSETQVAQNSTLYMIYSLNFPILILSTTKAVKLSDEFVEKVQGIVYAEARLRKSIEDRINKELNSMNSAEQKLELDEQNKRIEERSHLQEQKLSKEELKNVQKAIEDSYSKINFFDSEIARSFEDEDKLREPLENFGEKERQKDIEKEVTAREDIKRKQKIEEKNLLGLREQREQLQEKVSSEACRLERLKILGTDPLLEKQKECEKQRQAKLKKQRVEELKKLEEEIKLLVADPQKEMTPEKAQLLINLLNQYGPFIAKNFEIGTSLTSTKTIQLASTEKKSVQQEKFAYDAQVSLIAAGIPIQGGPKGDYTTTKELVDKYVMESSRVSITSTGGIGPFSLNQKSWLQSSTRSEYWRVISYDDFIPVIKELDEETCKKCVELLKLKAPRTEQEALINKTSFMLCGDYAKLLELTTKEKADLGWKPYLFVQYVEGKGFDFQHNSDDSDSKERFVAHYPTLNSDEYYIGQCPTTRNQKKPEEGIKLQLGNLIKLGDMKVEVPALKKPISFEEVWTDKGSWNQDAYSCWKPMPPKGYITLGHIFIRRDAKSDYNPPDDATDRVDKFMCVHESLVVPGKLTRIWDSKGVKANAGVSIWRIDAIDEKTAFGGYTFYCHPDEDKAPDVAVYCLSKNPNLIELGPKP